MDNGEGVAVIAPQKEKKEKKSDKKPKKMHIALFFDGTLNNRFNIEAREHNTEDYQDNTESGSSFENGRTNIAIMESHIEETAKGYDFFKSEYIEGQGTFNLEGDSFWGYALAIGDSGVPSRAEQGVDKAMTAILAFEDFEKDLHYIEKLTIDVFGFSRGAATARYAIHLLLKDEDKLFNRLQKFGYEVEESVIEVGFAGLYDTVLSYLASQKFKSSNNRLEQKAIKYAKKAVHLASADEHRKDFPLHNIKGAKCKGGEEYFLPGVHSDVGGSYNTADEEKIKSKEDSRNEEYEDDIVYSVKNSEKMLINKGKPEEIEQDRKNLIEQGWYTEDEIKIEIKYRRRRRGGSVINRREAYALLKVNRTGIESAYSNIPLKIMAEFARGEHANLTINSKLEDRANKIIEKAELTDFETRIKGYVAGTSNSKPEDWLDDLSLKEIRHKHFNFSARVGIGYAPRIKDGKRTRFIYDA